MEAGADFAELVFAAVDDCVVLAAEVFVAGFFVAEVLAAGFFVAEVFAAGFFFVAGLSAAAFSTSSPALSGRKE